MTTSIDLKQLEKRAFRSTYQDGLWDIYYGLIVMFMAIFMDRPEDGYSWVNIVLMAAGFLLAYLLFRGGKKLITLPRLGQVTFGPVRKARKRTMTIILLIFIAFQVLLLVFTFLGWLVPQVGKLIDRLLPGSNDLLAVSLIGAMIVCVGMTISAHYSDFLRGYYIALLMAVAVFLILFLDRPIFPLLIGAVIVIPGIVLLVRFIRQHPLPTVEDNHD